MSTQQLLYVVVGLLLAGIGLLLVLLRRRRPSRSPVRDPARGDVDLLSPMAERAAIGIGDSVFHHLGELSARQQEQLSQVMDALQRMTEASQLGARELREEVAAALK